MEREISEKNRKPRRTYGTPSYHYRNYFALGIIVTGCVLFAAFAYTPIFQKANEKVKGGLFKPSEDEISRRYLFSYFARKRGDEIARLIKEKEDFFKDR